MKPKLLPLFCLIVISLFAAAFFVTNNTVEGYEYRYYNCIKYVGEGTIYEGQPFCYEGFLIFPIGFLLSRLFDPSHLQLSAKILFLLLSAGLFFFLAKILKKELGEREREGVGGGGRTLLFISPLPCFRVLPFTRASGYPFLCFFVSIRILYSFLYIL